MHAACVLFAGMHVVLLPFNYGFSREGKYVTTCDEFTVRGVDVDICVCMTMSTWWVWNIY